jgi:hypothetical protein
MVTRPLGWSLLAVASVLACVLTGQRLAETRRASGLLQREIGLATLEEATLQRQLAQDRHAHARGLLAPHRRPLTPEFPLILQRIPTQVRVQEMRITPTEWQVMGQRAVGTEQETKSPFTLHLARSETGKDR